MPTAKDQFSLDGDLQLHFTRDQGGKCAAFTVAGGGVFDIEFLRRP